MYIDPTEGNWYTLVIEATERNWFILVLEATEVNWYVLVFKDISILWSLNQIVMNLLKDTGIYVICMLWTNWSKLVWRLKFPAFFSTYFQLWMKYCVTQIYLLKQTGISPLHYWNKLVWFASRIIPVYFSSAKILFTNACLLCIYHYFSDFTK